jgi:hypothetical protein
VYILPEDGLQKPKHVVMGIEEYEIKIVAIDGTP